MEERILVSVVMPVYNHEDYLKDAIESVLMQEVSFRYELLIGEDQSTDHSLQIIREYEKRYPDRIKVFARTENMGGMRNTHDLRLKAVGAYMIHLEGDDYWTDSHKLQRQVDFLESHPDYIACAHRFRVVNREKEVYYDRDFEVQFFQDNEYTKEIFEQGLMLSHANTLLFRNIFRDESIPTDFWLKFHHVAGDYTLHALLVLNGKMYCMPEYMSCYRKVTDQNSYSFSALQQRNNRRDKLFQSAVELEEILNRYYKVSCKARKKSAFASGVMYWYYHRGKENFRVVRNMIQISKQPLLYSVWFMYLVSARFWKNLTGRRGERVAF